MERKCRLILLPSRLELVLYIWDVQCACGGYLEISGCHVKCHSHNKYTHMADEGKWKHRSVIMLTKTSMYMMDW